MSIRVALNHRTKYRYDRPIILLPQVVRLRPAPHCRTPILSYSLTVHPKPHFLNWQQDPYSNYLARIVFPELTRRREMSVEVDLVAEMTAVNPFNFFIEDTAEHHPFNYETVLARELLPYLETRRLRRASGLGPRAARQSQDRSNLSRGDQQALAFPRIGYVIRMEPGVQTCERTLTLGTGSCRDSAWLLRKLLRHLGMAALLYRAT